MKLTRQIKRRVTQAIVKRGVHVFHMPGVADKLRKLMPKGTTFTVENPPEVFVDPQGDGDLRNALFAKCRDVGASENILVISPNAS